MAFHATTSGVAGRTCWRKAIWSCETAKCATERSTCKTQGGSEGRGHTDATGTVGDSPYQTVDGKKSVDAGAGCDKGKGKCDVVHGQAHGPAASEWTEGVAHVCTYGHIADPTPAIWPAVMSGLRIFSLELPFPGFSLVALVLLSLACSRSALAVLSVGVCSAGNHLFAASLWREFNISFSFLG